MSSPPPALSPSSPPSPPSTPSASPPSNSTSPPPPPPPNSTSPPPSNSTSPPTTPPVTPSVSPPAPSGRSPPLPPRHQTPPSKNPPTSKSPPSPPASNNSLSTATVVGIAAGVVAILVVLSLICICCRKKRRKARPSSEYYGGPPPPLSPHKDDPYGGQAPNPYGGQPQNWQHIAPPPAEHIVKIPPQPPAPPSYASRPPQFPTPAPPPPPVFSSGGSGSNYSGSEILPPPSPGGFSGFSKSTFTYEELALATNGFSDDNLLGQGGFGYVHKGVLPSGKEVAVKQLKSGSGQGEREFQAEVEIISRVHHRYFVSLVGYCISGGHRLFVYEFVPNKTLEFHLHGNDEPTMDWPTRLKIALDSAKGLAYLHEDCKFLVITIRLSLFIICSIVVEWQVVSIFQHIAKYKAGIVPVQFRRSFADGFPNLFINNAQDIRGQHVAFLASFSSPAVIFEQISVIYVLPKLFIASFTLVLPFFPTGSFEQMEEEGDVATAFTMARVLSMIPKSRGGPTSLVTYDIHALQYAYMSDAKPVIDCIDVMNTNELFPHSLCKCTRPI